MQKIKTFLWYDNDAHEAVELYVSIFKNSRIAKVSYYEEGAPLPEGTPFIIDFELDGQEFTAMNAGPHFQFTEAISLYVDCEDQAEVDYIWEQFLDNGATEQQCGWLKDKYGLSWQIVPKQLAQLMADPDKEKAGRVMDAIMKMIKIDVAELQKAYDGK